MSEYLDFSKIDDVEIEQVDAFSTNSFISTYFPQIGLTLGKGSLRQAYDIVSLESTTIPLFDELIRIKLGTIKQTISSNEYHDTLERRISLNLKEKIGNLPKGKVTFDIYSQEVGYGNDEISFVKGSHELYNALIENEILKTN